jgi:hypothetical protein
MAVRKRVTITFFGLGLFLIGFLVVGAARQIGGLAEVATGEGTLTSDNGENLRIKAVAVFLRENGDAEICIMTSRENVYAGGRWFHGADRRRAVRLEITNDTEGRCASGHGTLFLQGGCVPVAGLNVTMLRLDGTTFEAEFITKLSQPCPNP